MPDASVLPRRDAGGRVEVPVHVLRIDGVERAPSDRRRRRAGPALPRARAVTGVEDTKPAAPLVLRLTIEDCEPLAGSLSTEDGVHELAFTGWLGLVETLTLLRRRARRRY